MSNMGVDPKLKEEILKAYESGWEPSLIRAVEEAVAGSTGLQVKLLQSQSLNKAPFAGQNASQVTGIIGLNAGVIVGNICVMFTNDAILEIANTVYDKDYKTIEPAVLDCVGEITNLVHGIFKRHISEKGYFLKMSLPNVILGQHEVVSLVATKYFKADFELPSGKKVEVTLTIDLGKE